PCQRTACDAAETAARDIPGWSGRGVMARPHVAHLRQRPAPRRRRAKQKTKQKKASARKVTATAPRAHKRAAETTARRKAARRGQRTLPQSEFNRRVVSKSKPTNKLLRLHQKARNITSIHELYEMFTVKAG